MTAVVSHDPFRSRDRGGRAPRLADEPAARPVRVLAVVDRYPPFVNAGAEWMLHAMLRHLAARGHVVDVVTAVNEPARVDGVRVWPSAAVGTLSRTADVVVGHLMWTPQAIEAARVRRLPLIYLVHNDNQLRHWSLSPADVTAVVWNSEWLSAADSHRQWTGPAEIVRPPCRIADYRVDRTGAEHVTLVNPNPEKGSELFYRLAAKNRHRRFLVVGGAYGVQRKPRRTEPNVEYQPPTGRIADDVYRRTRVLLVPSKYESWGRVAVEAFCSGVPVIAHPTAGLREALGDAGIFVDRDDTAGWQSALDRLDDPAEYAATSAAASARAVELDEIADEDLDRWERLVRRAAASVTYDHRQAGGTARDHR